MITALLHPEVVTVHQMQIGAPDADGVPITTPTPRTWKPVNVQREATSEDNAGIEATTTSVRMSGPLAEWIVDTDRLSWNERDWRIQGDPAHYRAGALDHTELTATTWKGR